MIRDIRTRLRAGSAFPLARVQEVLNREGA
jgi:hypothetical protein